MINQEFIILFLLWHWVMTALYKDNLLPNKIEQLGHKIKFNLLLDLSECKFCMGTWGALFLCSGYAVYEGDCFIVLWGFMFASLEALIKK